MTKVTFPVEAGHILMFARAIGDENPAFTDADAARQTEAGGIVAPPTFVQANAQFDADYRLRPKPGQPWIGSSKTPSGVATGGSAGGLHAEQHFEYHKPIRPGDVLTVTMTEGKSWEKQGRRAGKLFFSEFITEYRNEAGEVVVTARAIGVRTERPAQ